MSRRNWADDDRIYRAPPAKRPISGDRWVIVWLIIAILFLTGLWQSLQWLAQVFGNKR